MGPLVLSVLSLLALFLFLLLGAFFSAAEMAFTTLSRVRINQLAENNGKRGRRAKMVLNLYETRLNEVITTILICNNIMVIAAATVSVAYFTQIAQYGYFISTFVVVVFVTLFMDILPKNNKNPENVALFVAPVVLIFMTILLPVNKGIFMLREKFGAKKSSESEAADNAQQERLEQELIFMVEEAETDGIINEEDSQLITNAIEFNEVTVWDVLTPRVKIASVSINASITEIAESFRESGYSRMPVIENSIDEVRGIIHLRDFLKCMMTTSSQKPLTLLDIMTPAVYTVTGAPITEVLKLLKKEKSHMAIVADEYGGTEGLVTMEDILEELVGEIWDENDEVFEDFQKLNDTKHKVLGTAAIDKMFEYFDMEAEAESKSNTVCGWIMDMLRRVPEEGDSFTFEKLHVTVTKTNGRSAEECEIEIVEPTNDETEEEQQNEE